MIKKCNKYEALFTFANDETLKRHIETCDDCKSEHEKMENVSLLLREVKPYFKEKRRKTASLKIACAMFILFASTTTLGVINLNTDIADTIRYGSALSAEDLGLPVDSYGLLVVE